MSERAVGYARKSVKVDGSVSIASQQSRIKQYCTDAGLTLLRTYEDLLSGGKRNRPGFQAMLAAAMAGEFDWVIIDDQERWARDVEDTNAAIKVLLAAGVNIQDSRGSMDIHTADGRYVINIRASTAQHQREKTGENRAKRLLEKAQQGFLIGPTPLGYSTVARVTTKDPATGHLVQELFSRCADEGESLRDLAQWARAQGLELDRLGVRKILTNRTYTGVVVYHPREADRQMFDGQHPAIVSQALYDRAQAALQMRRLGGARHGWGRRPYPLSKIARCHHCGSPMVGTQSGKRRWRYMRCGRAQRLGREACEQRMVRAQVLEDQVGIYLAPFALPQDWQDEILDDVRSAASGQDDREFRRRLRVYEQLKDLDEINAADFERHESRLRAEYLPDLEQQVVDVTRAADLLQDVGRIWFETDDGGRRALTEEMFASMTVEGRRVSVIEPSEIYAPLFKIDRENRPDRWWCSLAPRVGLEPTTLRLTAACSTD